MQTGKLDFNSFKCDDAEVEKSVYFMNYKCCRNDWT